MSNQSAACTIQEYRKNYARQEYYKTLKTNCIIGYVLSALNLAIAIAGNPLGFLDVVIQIACLLGIQKGRIKGCAVGLVGYSIGGMILALATGGTPGGWLWMILGFSCLNVFKKIDKDYKLTMCPED